MKKLILIFLSVLPLCGASKNTYKVNLFPISEVRITGGYFKKAETLDMSYLMGLNPDRLLAPYLKEAGLNTKQENYPNWENTGLDGHIGGHYLSALSYMYSSTGNEEIGKRLDYFLSELYRCQKASGNGYLCGVPQGKQIWNEIKQGRINANPFGLNDRWVPLYNIHKIYAGLRDAYIIAGKEQAKEMLVALTNWMLDVVSDLSDSQIQNMLTSEHGGLNEVFADVYSITGETKYLTLAKRFSHKRILEPLFRKEDALTGIHANTQIPKVIGFKRIADLENNKAWNDAANFFWHTVVHQRSVSIGGNSVREHFHKSDDFSSMIESEQGPETCNTYNMLRLTQMLYKTSGNAYYIDFYERALYNHILSSINPVQGGFVYFTPMRPGHYRVYSQPQNCFWCCVGSGMENHAKYGEMIYAHKEDELIVNMFIPSTLEWKQQGMSFIQETRFPYTESTKLIVNTKKPRTMKVSFRCPNWIFLEKPVLKVNGISAHFTLHNGYATISREWKDGDTVEMLLPMEVRTMQLPDNSPYYSFMYGPIVLAANMGKERLDGQFADDSRGGHVASGPLLPLHEMPVIVGNEADLPKLIKKTSPERLEFSLEGAMYPKKFNGITLRPFFETHECRYIVYWRLATEYAVKQMKHNLSAIENERIKLDNITTDMVVCGEQQPESDHFVQMNDSEMGSNEGVPWRDTGGWFSYKMKTNGKSLQSIMVKIIPYKSLDAKISINGKEIGIITDTQEIQTFTVPNNLKSLPELEIKISRNTSNRSTKISSIRLIAE